MTDIPGADASVAALHAAFAKPVKYTGAGVFETTIMAVRTHAKAGVFMDDQQTVRKVSFEILKSALPEQPAKGNRIVQNDGAGPEWRVTEVGDSDEVDAWEAFVAKA
ncbi:MAG: hypothetical protein AAFY42_09590 [Pseudomonadota bacterium]